MPANHQLVWLPEGFKLLPFGVAKAKPKHPVLDYSTWTKQQVQLNYAFNASPVPPNRCVETSDAGTNAQFEARATAYVNCLLESWRPFATANGVTLPQRMKIRYCPLYTDAACADGMAGGRLVDDGVILLRVGLPKAKPTGRREPVRFWTYVIAHEFAHQLQWSFTLGEDNGLTILAGAVDSPADQDSGIMVRRQEMQAHCLGWAMVSRANRVTRSDLRQTGRLLADPGKPGDVDPDYGNPSSLNFWLRQGLRGHNGECNAGAADPPGWSSPTASRCRAADRRPRTVEIPAQTYPNP